MSSAEFTRWAAYLKREPFGYHIDNYRMGQICATVSNVVRKTIAAALGGGRVPLQKASDFYPEEVGKKVSSLTKRQKEQLEERRKRRKAQGIAHPIKPKDIEQRPQRGKRRHGNN